MYFNVYNFEIRLKSTIRERWTSVTLMVNVKQVMNVYNIINLG